MNSCLDELKINAEQVVTLYNQGLTVTEISRSLRLSKAVVSYILHASGYVPKSPGNTSNVPSKEQINEMIRCYEKGLNASEIGRQLGFSYKTVLKYLDRNNIRSTKPNFTSEQIQEANRLYKTGLPAHKVADIMGVSKPTILYHLEAVRPMGPVSQKVDSTYFDTTNTSDKAYWLGVMYADGNVDTNGNSLTLSSTDKELVEALKEALKAEHTVYANNRSLKNPKWKDTYTLRIFNNELRSSLMQHGCVPNKTDKVSYPQINSDLNRHFIRGLFDGDGSVWGKPGRGYFSITGYLPFLDEVQNIMVNEVGLTKTKLQERKPNYGDIRYGGKAPMKALYDYLYTDAECFLQRKKDKFEELVWS